MIKPRVIEVESMLEASIFLTISKRRYGMEVEGIPVEDFDREKSRKILCKSLWLQGCKPSSSIEGATSEKMAGQIHKTCHLELGCSGSLNPSVTVHLVNAGTSCFGRIYRLD